MAEPKRAASAGGSSEVGPEEPSAAPKRVAKRTIHAGGHVIKADPLPETPAESVSCSICGSDPARCSHGSDGGWAVEEKD